jgi:hypothetical protein
LLALGSDLVGAVIGVAGVVDVVGVAEAAGAEVVGVVEFGATSEPIGLASIVVGGFTAAVVTAPETAVDGLSAAPSALVAPRIQPSGAVTRST